MRKMCGFLCSLFGAIIIFSVILLGGACLLSPQYSHQLHKDHINLFVVAIIGLIMFIIGIVIAAASSSSTSYPSTSSSSTSYPFTEKGEKIPDDDYDPYDYSRGFPCGDD